MDAVALTDPAGHAYPAGQLPLQIAEGRPGPDPNTPAGHRLHSLAPLALKVPAGQSAGDGVTDPAAHAYPAAHGPLQEGAVMPLVLPKRPAGHGPEHSPDASAAEAP
jgi:hypothetical protein